MSCGSRFLNLQLNLKVNTETCKPILISRGLYRFVQPLQCVSNPLRSMSFAVSIHSPQIMNLTPLTPLPGHIVIFKTARFWSNFLQPFINLLVTSWSQLSPASGHDIHLKISKSNGQIAIEFTEHIYVTQRIKVYIFFFFSKMPTFPQYLYLVNWSECCLSWAVMNLGFSTKGTGFIDPLIFHFCSMLIRLFKQTKIKHLQWRWQFWEVDYCQGKQFFWRNTKSELMMAHDGRSRGSQCSQRP